MTTTDNDQEPTTKQGDVFADDQERQQYRRSKQLRPAMIYEIIMEEGRHETQREFQALWWSGIAAGLSISLSMVLMGILQAHLDASGSGAHLIAALGYSAGFVVVILGRQQLFTENTITVLLPYFARVPAVPSRSVLRVWSIVLASNLVGATAFSLVAAQTPLFAEAYRAEFLEIGRHVLQYSIWEMFIKGILAGWLIATLVWVLPAATGQAFFLIVFVTWIIGVAGLTHIVAGTTEVMFTVFNGESTVADVFRFMIPTLLGNICGGSVLFALISYAQVRNEAPSAKKPTDPG